MPALSLTPALSFLATVGRVPPIRPLRTFLRTTGHRFSPPRPLPFQSSRRPAEEAALSATGAGPHQRAEILHEARRGSVPTIVLGGFVPNATEQVYLLRGFFLRQGSLYYVNYPQLAFATNVVLAQLDDLVAELIRAGTPPVIFAVSFGAGLILEWLRRARQAGRRVDVRGLVFISPIGCVDDVIAPEGAKSATLLGRALQPCLASREAPDAKAVERSRTLFTRMFEAGAQNRAAVAGLLTSAELNRLRTAVVGTIRGIETRGAWERVQAMGAFLAPSGYFSQAFLPLTTAPTLILFAEAEEAVIAPHSPTRFAFESAHRAYFPASQCLRVRNPRGTPVQHASLIFHCFNFLPPISRFYSRLKSGKAHRAA